MKLRLVTGAAAAGLAFAVVALTSGIGSGPDTDRASGPQAVSSEFDPGRVVFARMGCGGCHTLAAAGSAGEIGPNLDQRLPRHTRASLKARIMMPPSEGAQFDMMPRDFRTRLNAEELDALVDFLLAAR
jgi:cytochrome c oxidase subunit 2